jgi:prepilin-type N-terminal cleavage/methylation domain-containing protein
MGRRAAGFTLMELAVVMTIVTILLTATVYTLSAQTEQRNLADTQRRLEDAKELLLSFAVLNGRLPCPASSTSNGDESPTGGGTCTDGYTGYLPAKAIGYAPTDPAGYGLDVWGNRIRYAVSINSNVTGAPDYTFTTGTNIRSNYSTSAGTNLVPNDLLICSSYGTSGSLSTSSPSCGALADATPGVSVTNQNIVVAVVWSQGKNFNTASYGTPPVAGQAGADEVFNNKIKSPANSVHGVFISHPPRPFSETNEFDDQMAWIPVNLLYSRMIAAGQLP